MNRDGEELMMLGMGREYCEGRNDDVRKEEEEHYGGTNEDGVVMSEVKTRNLKVEMKREE